MFKAIANGLLFGAIILMISSPVYATSCNLSKIEDSFKKAEIIFEGRVAEVKYIEPLQGSIAAPGPFWPSLHNNEEKSCGDKHVTFQILSAFKGNTADKITLFSDSCMGLGGHFEKDKTYLVYAWRHDDTLVTSSCDRTRRIDLPFIQGEPTIEDEMKALHKLSAKD